MAKAPVDHSFGIYNNIKDGNYWAAAGNAELLTLDVAPFVMKGTGSVEASFTEGSFEYYMNIAKNGDFSTAENSAVFYSGAGNDARAAAFVKSNPGKMTLNMTPAGKILNQADLYANFRQKK